MSTQTNLTSQSPAVGTRDKVKDKKNTQPKAGKGHLKLNRSIPSRAAAKGAPCDGNEPSCPMHVEPQLATNPTTTSTPVPASVLDNSESEMDTEQPANAKPVTAFDSRIQKKFNYYEIITKYPLPYLEGGFCRLPEKAQNMSNPKSYFCLICGKICTTIHSASGCQKAAELRRKREGAAPLKISLALDKASDAWAPRGSKLIPPEHWNLTPFAEVTIEDMFAGVLTLHYIPKEARISFSNLFKDLTNLALMSVKGAFEALLLLPRLIIPSRVHGSRAAARVSSLVGQFRLGQFQTLLEARNIVFPTAPHNNQRRAITLARAGELGRAASALQASPVLDPGLCYDKLKQLHPQVQEDIPPPDFPDRDPFTVDDVRDAIKHLKRLRAADVLGWTADVLKALCPDAITVLARLCIKIAKDIHYIPEHIRPFFFGAKLIPLKKKDDGVRPIAIGTIFRKLIGTSIMNSIKSTLPGFFSPVQFGVGIPGGAENIIHGIRELYRLHPNYHIVSLDLVNAFNSISRKVVVAQVNEHYPLLNPWIWQCYGSPSQLLVQGSPCIASSTGVQQGDPLGPLLFSLGLQPALRNALRYVQPFAYMDDIYLMGSPEHLHQALTSLSKDFSNLNLRINTKKCWSTVELQDAWSSISVTQHPVVMKAPFDPNAPTGPLQEKTMKMIGSVAELPDTQVALLLLRTINNSSLVYNIRTSVPGANAEKIGQLQEGVLRALAHILKVQPEAVAEVVTRVQMPLGPGLGFTNISRIAKEAYCASWLQAVTRLHALDKVRFRMPTFNSSSSNLPPSDVLARESLKDRILLKADPCLHLQHLKVAQKADAVLQEQFNSLPPVQKVIVKSLWGKFPGAWLSAIPTEKELTMPSGLMRVALCLFLGIQIDPQATSCPSCNALAHPSFNVHILKCTDQKAFYVRHDAIKFSVADLARQARIPVTIEKKVYTDSSKRPDIILHSFGRESQDVALDISVVDPFRADIKEDDPPLKAAMERERVKVSKYTTRSGSPLLFRPVVLEAYGGVTRECLQNVINPLIKRIDTYYPVNWAAPTAKMYWYQRLTLTLWHHNASKVKLFAKNY